jgi:hypothetical protein
VVDVMWVSRGARQGLPWHGKALAALRTAVRLFGINFAMENTDVEL